MADQHRIFYHNSRVSNVFFFGLSFALGSSEDLLSLNQIKLFIVLHMIIMNHVHILWKKVFEKIQDGGCLRTTILLCFISILKFMSTISFLGKITKCQKCLTDQNQESNNYLLFTNNFVPKKSGKSTFMPKTFCSPTKSTSHNFHQTPENT
jgi:hypothetical protein